MTTKDKVNMAIERFLSNKYVSNFVTWLQALTKEQWVNVAVGSFLVQILAAMLNLSMAFFLVLATAIAKEMLWDGWLGRGSTKISDCLYMMLGALITYILL